MTIRKLDDDAFAYYVSLGPERSYTKVAEHYGVGKKAIQRAANREDWTSRLRKIEAEARERTDARLTDGIEEMRTRHLKLLRAIEARGAEAIRDKALETGMDGVKAIAAAIKLERLIAGEPSERTGVIVEQVTRQEIDRLLANDNEPGQEEDGDDGADDW